MRVVATTAHCLLGDGSTYGYQALNPSLPHEPLAQAANRAPPQRHVDHTYRDFANFPLEELPTRKKAPTNFPSKLHQILSNPEYDHVSQNDKYFCLGLLCLDALTTEDLHRR